MTMLHHAAARVQHTRNNQNLKDILGEVARATSCACSRTRTAVETSTDL